MDRKNRQLNISCHFKERILHRFLRTISFGWWQNFVLDLFIFFFFALSVTKKRILRRLTAGNAEVTRSGLTTSAAQENPDRVEQNSREKKVPKKKKNHALHHSTICPISMNIIGFPPIQTFGLFRVKSSCYNVGSEVCVCSRLTPIPLL